MNCFKYGDLGVDIKIKSKFDPDIFWSKERNSYVMVKSEREVFFHPEHKNVDIVSINGLGEIRWKVSAYDASCPEHKTALEFFGVEFDG